MPAVVSLDAKSNQTYVDPLKRHLPEREQDLLMQLFFEVLYMPSNLVY